MKKSIKYISKIIIIMLLAIVAMTIINAIAPITVEANTNIFDENIEFIDEFIPNPIMNYGLFTPSTAKKGDSLPLIVWLHGSGERKGYVSNEGFMERGLPAVLKQWELEGFNSYIICPQANGDWYHEDDRDKLKKLLDEFIEEYNIDKSQIILSGHSMGGKRCFIYGPSITRIFFKISSIKWI